MIIEKVYGRSVKNEIGPIQEIWYWQEQFCAGSLEPRTKKNLGAYLLGHAMQSLHDWLGISKYGTFANSSGPEVIKLFFMLNSAEHEIAIAHKNWTTDKCKQDKFHAQLHELSMEKVL